MYTNARYTNQYNTLIQVDINGVTSFVPCAPGNLDYAMIMILVESGELVIQSYEPPPPMPITQITMRQCRLELLAEDLLDNVEAMITQAPRSVQIEWEYATVVDRSSPLVDSIGAALNLTDKQIDNLFEQASKL